MTFVYTILAFAVIGAVTVKAQPRNCSLRLEWRDEFGKAIAPTQIRFVDKTTGEDFGPRLSTTQTSAIPCGTYNFAVVRSVNPRAVFSREGTAGVWRTGQVLLVPPVEPIYLPTRDEPYTVARELREADARVAIIKNIDPIEPGMMLRFTHLYDGSRELFDIQSDGSCRINSILIGKYAATLESRGEIVGVAIVSIDTGSTPKLFEIPMQRIDVHDVRDRQR